MNSAFLSAARQCETPTIAYDVPAIKENARLIASLAAKAGGEAFYAVKANRHPTVLKGIAAAGFGADVASDVEYQAAASCGFSQFTCTTPGLTPELFAAIYNSGGTVYFDSAEQVQIARDVACDLKRHSVRLSLPGSYSNFGVSELELGTIRDRLGFAPRKFHLHSDEFKDLLDVLRRIVWARRCVSDFGATTVNFGGGYAVLSNDRRMLSLAFEQFGNIARQSGVSIFFEFGKIMLARYGVLVCTVVSKKTRGDQQVVVVDASAFNLGDWERRSYLGVSGDHRPRVTTSVVGCTCFEGDVFFCGANLPQFDIGEKLMIGLCGAYNTSIGATLHGLPQPTELCFGADA